jgi:uncharacterized membrane protein
MKSKFAWILATVSSRFWFRVSLYAIGAAAVLLAELLAPLIPAWLVESVGDGASQVLLRVLVSSMLVVATFLLGTMVQAYSAAANLATLRATRILIGDPKSQRVLSTFLGAFVFAMVSLLSEAFDYFNPAGEAVLLGATTLVTAVVITTLFGWLDYLANLVRLGDTIRKVELRATQVLETRLEDPNLGGIPADGSIEPNWPVATKETGYVHHLDVARLRTVAEASGGFVAVNRIPGALADPSTPLAYLSWNASAEDRKKIQAAFTLGHERSFDQDPRFCLIVLCEIASRALSQGVNDPGTAISVIGAQQRLLTAWGQGTGRKSDRKIPCLRVQTPSLSAQDLFEDAFGPLTRDAALMVEVGQRLQGALCNLAASGRDDYILAARATSGKALRHAEASLRLAEDRQRLAALAREFGASQEIQPVSGS